MYGFRPSSSVTEAVVGGRAQAMAQQLGLECELLEVPGYWPFLELDADIALVIDPGSDHNLVLPAEVVVSLNPVIRNLLEADP